MVGKAITLWQPWASLCVIPREARFKERHRVEGGSVSCGHCNRTFTFNFMRDQGPHRCSCRQAVAARAEANRPFKTIETRSWKAPDSLIGQRIAIHAALTKPGKDDVPWEYIGDGCDGFDVGPVSVSWPKRRAKYPPRMYGEDGSLHPLPLGAVVGTAVLADCVPMVARGSAPSPGTMQLTLVEDGRLFLDSGMNGCSDVTGQRPFGLFEPGRWAWVLTDAVRFGEPIPCPGRQRVWNVPDDLRYIFARGALT